MKFVFPVTFLITFLSQGIKLEKHLAAKIPVWPRSDCVGFMQLYLKLCWVLRVAKNFIGGSEGTIYSRYFECMLCFPLYFILDYITWIPRLFLSRYIGRIDIRFHIFRHLSVESSPKISEVGPGSVRALTLNSVSDFQYQP